MKTSDTNIHRILLVGNVTNAFSDAEAVRQLPCEIQSGIAGAAAAATKGSFVSIAVVMGDFSDNLNSALEMLNNLKGDAKIILLARMCEEPAAMSLVDSASNGTAGADDYLICPLGANEFYESVTRTERPEKRWIAAVAPVDAGTAKKISQLERLATEDDLTELKNRRYIWEFSRQIIERAREENGRVTLLVFDIDNFKHYNDVYGHSAGDQVLKQAAVLMRRCCRGHDVVGRIGGDEFAVLFWDNRQRKTRLEEAERRSAAADHPKEAIFIAKRFRRELGKAELNGLGPEGKGVLTISGGLASFPQDGSTITQLFQQADEALLEAKRNGKNKIYLVGKPESDIAEIE